MARNKYQQRSRKRMRKGQMAKLLAQDTQFVGECAAAAGTTPDQVKPKELVRRFLRGRPAATPRG